MRFLCTNCNYIYDESEWDDEEGYPSGTLLNDLGDIYECPVCGDDRDSFQEIQEEVNYIDEKENLFALEIDHFPEIEIEGDKIKVSIWADMHPMWESHRISSVAFYDSLWDLVEEKFLEIDDEPVCEFDYFGESEFEIQVRCSLHGVWGRKYEEKL